MVSDIKRMFQLQSFSFQKRNLVVRIRIHCCCDAVKLSLSVIFVVKLFIAPQTQFSLDTGAKTELMSAIKLCVNCLCWTKPEFDLRKYFTPHSFCWSQII